MIQVTYTSDRETGYLIKLQTNHWLGDIIPVKEWLMFEVAKTSIKNGSINTILIWIKT